MRNPVRLDEHNHLKIAGDITFENVPMLINEGLSFISSLNEVVIDFSHVKKVNSAGLVLMLAWSRAAKSRKISVKYVNVPDSLQAIAKLTSVDDLLWTN